MTEAECDARLAKLLAQLDRGIITFAEFSAAVHRLTAEVAATQP